MTIDKNSLNNAEPLHRKWLYAIKQWAKKHWIISGILIVVALWNTFWWHYNTPIRNPWPTDAYTIKGRFPFDKGYELIFVMNSFGKAPWHERICGGVRTEHATCSSRNIVRFKPTKIDDQHYEITLYRDYYFSGLPLWKTSLNTLVYRPIPQLNIEKEPITQYERRGIPVICDDREKAINNKKDAFRNGMPFCMTQYIDPDRKFGHIKYKDILLPESAKASKNLEVRDFWLYSELDDMLEKNSPTLSHTQ